VKSKHIILLGLPIIASMLTGCEQKPQTVRVCKDTSGKVVDNVHCERIQNTGHGTASSGNTFMWWYMGYMSGRPAGGYPVGSYIPQGSGYAAAPANQHIVSNTGTTIAKPASRVGGFGSTGRGYSAGT
jgi:hypothetical protein